MTIEEVIQIGEGLKQLMPQVEYKTAYEAPKSVLPAGCPLYATIENTCKIFSTGDHTIRALIRDNADFPALRIGKKIIIDVPGFYQWLHERNGETLLEFERTGM